MSGSQTSAIQTIQVIFDQNFATPSVKDIAQDNVVNKSELLNDQGVDCILIEGAGENYSSISLVFSGSSTALNIAKYADVVDKKWSVKLTVAEIESLKANNGLITYTVVQTDSKSGVSSVALKKSFTVDLLPPLLPTGSALDAANKFNNIDSSPSSQAADKTISDAESRAGVDIAVPIAKVGGNFVMAAGEKITLVWANASGELSYEKILTANDFVAGKDYVIIQVPLDFIAKFGQRTQVTVGVKYTDKAGNTSAVLPLISGLTVNPPPEAPGVAELGGDGYLNQSELLAINSKTSSLEISGSSSSKDTSGKVSLIIYAINDQSTPLKTINDITVNEAGLWKTNISGSLVNSWSDGQYVLIATYTTNGRSSSPTKSVFELDRIRPDAPTTSNINTANLENSTYELSGGLTRPWINGNGPNGTSAQTDRYSIDNQSKAMNDVNVRVPLPANAKVGDVVILTWGVAKPGIDNTVIQAVSNSDIAKGVMTVKVPSSLITAMGDDNNLNIKAKFTDSAGNNGVEFDVVKGKFVDAAPVSVKNIRTSFGEWLNLNLSKTNWSISGDCDANAEIEMVMRGVNGYTTPPIRLWKNSAGAFLFANGTWTISKNDIDTQIIKNLGEGLVSVNVLQRDLNGNPSKSTDFNFRIDLTPPDAPVVDSSVKNKLTFLNYASGKNISGANENNAKVFVYFELLNADNSVRFTTSTYEATVNANRWEYVVSQSALNDLLTKYASISTGGKVRVNAYQTDQASNPSNVTQEVFSFESQQLASPTFVSVDGLDTSNTYSTDTVISAADFESNNNLITVKGKASEAGLKIRLVLSKYFSSSSNTIVKFWDIDVDSSLNWSVSLNKSVFTTDAKYGLSMTAQKFDSNQVIDNESAVQKLTFNNGSQDYFTVDTNGPVLTAQSILADTSTGNAKSGDILKVFLTFSENIVADANNKDTPELILKGFQDGLQRRAIYKGVNSANPNQLLFEYTVSDTDNADAGALGIQSIDWKNTVFKDKYGNTKQTDPAITTTANSILVDTKAPNVTVEIFNIAGTDSNSPGGECINSSESNSVTVTVKLSGDIEVGNNLNVKWGDIVSSQQITDTDKTAGWKIITIDPNSLLNKEGSFNVIAWVTDLADNKSTESLVKTVSVDTIKPQPLTINTWLSDNLVNEAESKTSFPFITGTGVEAGSTLTAKFIYKSANGKESGYSLDIKADLNNSGSWYIDSNTIDYFLKNIYSYGKFDLHVQQSDANGNTSDNKIQSYFIDAESPNPPSSVEIPAATDGWINSNEANNLDIKVNFGSIRAPKVGDTLTVKFWKYGYADANYAVGQKADFELANIVLSQADIDNGYRLINISTPTMAQDANLSVPQKIKYEVNVIDQGGNVSSSQSQTAYLDTNIKTPTVNTDADDTNMVNNVNPSQAQGDMHLRGGNIEVFEGNTSNTNLCINFTSPYAKITKQNVSYKADGTFDFVLNPADFKQLLAGRETAFVSYEVYQIDKAGNVSNKCADSFFVQLTLSQPVLQNFTGDNILSLAELSKSQTLSGVSVPNTDIEVKLFVDNGSGTFVEIPSLSKSITASNNTKGSWSVNYTPAELTTLTSQSTALNFNARFEVVARQNDQKSSTAQLDFEVYRQVAASQPPSISKFDANGDGANNDGLEIGFDDNVKVADMLSALNTYCSNNNKVWGSNFKIEAKDSTKIGGELYAKTFRISLGLDRNISSTTQIVIPKKNIVNKANNAPTNDVVLNVPDLFVQVPMLLDGTWFTDNILNFTESKKVISYDLVMYDDTATFKPKATDVFTIYVDGKALSNYTQKSLTAFNPNPALSASTDWANNPPRLSLTVGAATIANPNIPIDTQRQGVHTVTAQISSNDGASTGYYSIAHTVVVDTVVDTTVKKVVVTNYSGTADTFNAKDTLLIEFAEALTLSNTDLPASFGQNATVRAVGGYDKPLTYDTKFSADISASKKSTVWEITFGANATLTKNSEISFSGLNDVAENNSSTITAKLNSDVFDTPIAAYIGVVSTDNVISSSDAKGMIKVTVNLTGAKPGDVVKLYMDGTDSSNLIQNSTDSNNPQNAVTVTANSLNSVDFFVNASDFGADGLRNLVATVQRTTNGTVIQSDMRNVYVSENSTHWSATGGMIWFDTDNIVQATGSSVDIWTSSVGGSVATSVGAPTTANPNGSNVKPVLIRNSVNGHNQLFFNGAEFYWNGSKWASNLTVNGKVTGTYMTFTDPNFLFADTSKKGVDAVANKIPYTVIANGRKDTALVDSYLTSIGSNGTQDNLYSGNVGLAYWNAGILEFNRIEASQSSNYVGNNYRNSNLTNPPANTNAIPWFKPGAVPDLGFNPRDPINGSNFGYLRPMRSASLGTQLLLSHTYNTVPTGTNTSGDVYFYSNGQLIGHRNTDYKITLGGGTATTSQSAYELLVRNQFLIGATSKIDTSITNASDLGKNVTNLWQGMVGDIIWANKNISGAYLQEINTYQAVKFGTVGYVVPPKTSSANYDLSVSADTMNLLDDVLLLNQFANAGNGTQTVTVAGADFVNTGNGNDFFTLKDLKFRYLDGGKDEDTLNLSVDYSGSANIYLSDFVSNSRGDSTSKSSAFVDNARVNTNGFHKLSGIEIIDLSTNTNAQTLYLSADDVYQLSDTHSLKIKMDSNDVLLVNNMGIKNNGHYYKLSNNTWYDFYYAQDASSVYTQGGDKFASVKYFDLSNNNTILNLNFDHALKTSDGSSLSPLKFTVTGLGSYTYSISNITDISFFNQQQSIRLQTSTAIKGPISVSYTDSATQLKDAQGRDMPALTWMIGSDLADFDTGITVLNASGKSKPVVILGGGGDDQLTGSNFDDTLVGGNDSDTMTGGVGSDTFLFFKESSNSTLSEIAGLKGDVITDFSFGKNGANNADTIKLDHLFSTSVVSQLGQGATKDADKLAGYLNFEWTKDNSKLQLVCSADLQGTSKFSKLFTLTDLQDSVVNASYNPDQPDVSRLSGVETTSNAILQKLLEEGRLVIQ